MTPRLEPIDPATLTPDAAELYSRYTSGERAKPGAAFMLVTGDGQLTGPPSTWMLNPTLGLRMEQLGYGVRFELTLTDRWREIVILMVAEREDSPFERYAHHPAGRAAGLSEAEIAALDAGSFAGVDATERAFVACTRALLDRGRLSDEEWDDAVRSCGRSAMLEIVTLIGWYRLMALQLRVFDVEPPGAAETS